MRTLDAYKVDAFTEHAYAGNPAGVVPDADGLTEAQMRAIAREMNLSETAFVLRPTVGDADLRLRYFTPTAEIPLCGHATIGALHLLAEEGRIRAPCTVRAQTNVGVLPVEVRDDGRVFLESERLAYAPSPVPSDALAQLLGVPRASLLDDGPGPLLVSRKLFVPVNGLATMGALRPDMDGIAQLADLGIEGVAPVSFETRSPDALTHIRFFAPALGIDEDPVTGTAHMGLAGYLLKAGRMHVKCVFLGEQGEFTGRAGCVEVLVEGTLDAPHIRIGGRAVTTLRGKMLAPPE